MRYWWGILEAVAEVVAEADGVHLVVDPDALVLRHVGESDLLRAVLAAFRAARVRVLLHVPGAGQYANLAPEGVARVHLEPEVRVAELEGVLVHVTLPPYLRLQVPVARMMQNPAELVAHLERGPVVAALELALVVAHAEVAAGPVALWPFPTRPLPPEAVAA